MVWYAAVDDIGVAGEARGAVADVPSYWRVPALTVLADTGICRPVLHRAFAVWLVRDGPIQQSRSNHLGVNAMLQIARPEPVPVLAGDQEAQSVPADAITGARQVQVERLKWHAQVDAAAAHADTEPVRKPLHDLHPGADHGAVADRGARATVEQRGRDAATEDKQRHIRRARDGKGPAGSVPRGGRGQRPGIGCQEHRAPDPDGERRTGGARWDHVAHRDTVTLGLLSRRRLPDTLSSQVRLNPGREHPEPMPKG